MSRKKRDLTHQESGSFLAMDKIVPKMEEGMTMTRFYATGRRPENRRFCVNVARMIVFWRKPDRSDRPVEGSGIYV